MDKTKSKRSILQSLCFSYGNLACSSNHKPKREAFKNLAIAMGLKEKDFEEWAKDKEWW